MVAEKQAHSRAGFTLVELLVVIGIIALLISILLPSLNKARESAAGVKCASNMRQFYLANMTYASMNRGFVIPGRKATDKTAEVDPGVAVDTGNVNFIIDKEYQWFGTELLGKGVGLRLRPYNATDLNDAAAAFNDAMSTLAKYLDCPTTSRDQLIPAGGYNFPSDYTYNADMGDFRYYLGGSNTTQRCPYIQAAKIPSWVLMMTEMRNLAAGNQYNFSTVNDLTLRKNGNPADSGYGRIGNPHNKKANMLFSDGSVTAANPFDWNVLGSTDATNIPLAPAGTLAKNWMTTRYTPNRGAIPNPNYSYWFPGEKGRARPF